MLYSDNSHVLQQQDNWNVFYTFSMANLFKYHPDDEELCEPNLGMSSFPMERDECKTIAWNE